MHLHYLEKCDGMQHASAAFAAYYFTVCTASSEDQLKLKTVVITLIVAKTFVLHIFYIFKLKIVF